MTIDQLLIFAVLATTMGLFISNFWRYDVVAGIALITAVLIGIVPEEKAFHGFSHPAVITVACVLVISQALQNSGLVETFLRYLAFSRKKFLTQILANCGITALLSAFMNNIGALALMLPVTMRDARKAGRPVSRLLMPLSFASLLGGLVTLIGTPPNIVIATFRADNMGEPFGMFSFTPVGLVVALAGLGFLTLIGWRLLPIHDASSQRGAGGYSEIAKYITEIRIPEGSALIDTTIRDLEARCENDISVIALIRQGRRRIAPPSAAPLLQDDVLIVEGATEALQPILENPGLVEAGAGSVDLEQLNSPEVQAVEVVVMPNSLIEGVSMREMEIHQRFGINLLAVAREGRAPRVRLRHIKFEVGDMLLLQGEPAALEQFCQSVRCLIIKNRGVEISSRRGVFLIPSIFALGILSAALGWVPIHIAFVMVVGFLVVFRMLSLRDAYRSIEWPVIVLLGFLIPLGEALQTTGATDLIANWIVMLAEQIPVWLLLGLLILVSMLLSDVVHNTPTAVLMAPIAFSLAGQMGLPPDALLMAVAVGAASPFLTPIGHQSNTLVMGPGGYNFGDYWRMGLPLDVVIICAAVPMIMLVWL